MGVFEHGVLLPPYHNVNSENEARPLNIRVAHSWTNQCPHCIPIYSNAIHRKIPIGFVLSPVLAAQILIVICESPSFFGKSHILSNIPHDIPRIFPHSHDIPGIFPCHSHISTAFHSCHWPFFFGATWSGRPARPCRRWPQGWRAWPKRDGAAPARIETRGRGPAKCETSMGSDRCWYSQKISLKIPFKIDSDNV